MQVYQDNHDAFDEVLNDSMIVLARQHKTAIFNEINKRQSKQKEEARRIEKEKSDRAARKKLRSQLREKHRIELLKEQINTEILATAQQLEYKNSMKIYDVREAGTTDDGIVLIGGFVGELIISFACMFEYIQATP